MLSTLPYGRYGQGQQIWYCDVLSLFGQGNNYQHREKFQCVSWVTNQHVFLWPTQASIRRKVRANEPITELYLDCMTPPLDQSRGSDLILSHVIHSMKISHSSTGMFCLLTGSAVPLRNWNDPSVRDDGCFPSNPPNLANTTPHKIICFLEFGSL